MNARTHLSEFAWLAIILAVLAWSWIGAYDPGVWVMEVLPVFIAVPVLAFTRSRFPLTPLVYALILVHAIVLMVGGALHLRPCALGLLVAGVVRFQP